MVNEARHGLEKQQNAMLACYMCRKRKIKCGRQLPKCRTCRETDQECAYPSRAMRPGPKIGSVNKNVSQKRQYERRNDEEHTQPQHGVTTRARSDQPSVSDSSSSSTGHTVSSTVPSLSFIIHPTSQDCSVAQIDPTRHTSDSCNGVDGLTISCENLGLTTSQLDILLARYFEVNTSFQLFRKPELWTKLKDIPTTTHQTALLASILSFGLKGLTSTEASRLVNANMMSDLFEPPSIHFRSLSIRYMDQALAELGDETVSLPLLQAMILNAHCLLVQGVQGRAWRYLGLCIRAAYELNIHLIDAGKNPQVPPVSPENWCIEEEWRRAWWAIWEMDVFASVVRRCPAGIDWTQNDTFLPAEDERWYNGQPQQSCFLEFNVNDRWKSLVASKNQAPKAWYIIINSLMKDAQTISSPAGIDKPHLAATLLSQRADRCYARYDRGQQVNKKTAAIGRLKTISNALYCTISALPTDLKYQGQVLNFGGCRLQRESAITQRLSHSFVYSLYLMTELTKMMILKYYVFKPSVDWPTISEQHHSVSNVHDVDTPRCVTSKSKYLEQYFDSANRVISMIRSCHEDHYKHVNPFLAIAVWLAGSIELLQRSRLPDGSSDKDLVTSNFDLASLIYRGTVAFWNMSKVPLRNWDTLESGLGAIKDNPAGGESFHYEAPCIFKLNSLHNAQSIFHGGNEKEMSRDTYNNHGEVLSADPASNVGTTRFNDNEERIAEQRQASAALEMEAPLPGIFPSADRIHRETRTKTAGQPSFDGIQHGMGPSQPELTATETSAPQATNHSAYSMDLLENVPSFGIELQEMSGDFLNYLDDIFSGSYLPQNRSS